MLKSLKDETEMNNLSKQIKELESSVTTQDQENDDLEAWIKAAESELNCING